MPNLSSITQAPIPGDNAFVHHSQRVAAYPRRAMLSSGTHSAHSDGTYKDPRAPIAAQGQSKAVTHKPEGVAGRGIPLAPSQVKPRPISGKLN